MRPMLRLRRRPPVLAEISAGPPPGAGPGALRRGDLDAYGGLLERLDGQRTVLVTGEADDLAAAAVSLATTAAVGIATTAAAVGRQTVLVECDLAQPRLAEALGLATAPGMVEYLRGEAEAEALLKPVVLAGPGSGGAAGPLVCVVAGRPAADAAELLASERLREALERIGAAYELAVVAGPSLRRHRSLTALMSQADATIACLSRSNRRRKLAVPVTGLLVQG